MFAELHGFVKSERVPAMVSKGHPPLAYLHDNADYSLIRRQGIPPESPLILYSIHETKL